jgi:hypothetical protein
MTARLHAFPKPRRTRHISDRGRRLLNRIAAECSDTSYCRLSGRSLAEATAGSARHHSTGQTALKRLRARGLIEGDFVTGWRLTAAGWEAQRGER